MNQNIKNIEDRGLNIQHLFIHETQRTTQNNLLTSDSQSSDFLYEDENERKLHLNAVEMLALRIGSPQEEVQRIYEIVLRRFKKVAKIKDFLPVLVSKRVEYLLNKRKK